MPRKPKTMADYPPEFMDAWKLACEGKLMLSLDSAGTARNLIQKLYAFRKRVAEEAPEIGSKFYLVDLRVHDEAGNVIVGKATAVPGKAIIRPYNPGWKDQIRQQISQKVEPPAFTHPQGTSPALPEVALAPPAPAEDNVGSTLSNLGYGVDE